MEMDGDSLLKKSYSVGEEVAAVITQVTLHDMKYNIYMYDCCLCLWLHGLICLKYKAIIIMLAVCQYD